jgi:hypothetical protein
VFPVDPMVLGRICQLQILDPVVTPVGIPMMYQFTGEQMSTKVAFHHQNVLVHAP